jgi:hypothetical protein
MERFDPSFSPFAMNPPVDFEQHYLQVAGFSEQGVQAAHPAMIWHRAFRRETKMAGSDNSNDRKVTLAQQIFGVETFFGFPPEPKTNDMSAARMPLVVERDSRVRESSSPAAANMEPIERVVQQRQLKTAAELAEMIELDLARHPDCPKEGFRVTVYGGSHWRAMLTITPAAGGIRNPQEWRDLTDDLAERLRNGYDLAWE